MQCAINKSIKKHNTYLYIEKQDDFVRIPRSLLQLSGKLEFVMELELTPTRALVLADPNEIRSHLREQGYFLQMPPSD